MDNPKTFSEIWTNAQVERSAYLSSLFLSAFKTLKIDLRAAISKLATRGLGRIAAKSSYRLAHH